MLLWLSVRGLLLERMITPFIKLNRAEVAGDDIFLVFFPQLIQLSLVSGGLRGRAFRALPGLSSSV